MDTRRCCTIGPSTPSAANDMPMNVLETLPLWLIFLISLIAIGGAAYLVSKAIRSARVLAFADLGMEAIHEFVVEDMPVTVAVSANGVSVHAVGPEEWRRRIAARRAA